MNEGISSRGWNFSQPQSEVGLTWQTYRFRTIGRIYPRPVEQKADSGDLLALTIAESIHELGELSRPLDLEENLVVVVGHLDVEMLGFRLLICAASCTWGLVAVGHCGLVRYG